MNFENLPIGSGARGRIRNIPESTRLCFHCWLRNRGKDALQAAGNFTIDHLLCLEYRLPIFYVKENWQSVFKTQDGCGV